jgi:hypothetical protein
MFKEASREELRLIAPAAPAPEVVHAAERQVLARVPATTSPAAMSSRLSAVEGKGSGGAKQGGKAQLLKDVQKTFGNAYAQKVLEHYQEQPQGKRLAPAQPASPDPRGAGGGGRPTPEALAAQLAGQEKAERAPRSWGSRVQRQSASRVSSPSDPAEKEAEATAKSVMRMPASEPPAASTGPVASRGGGGRILSPQLQQPGIARSTEPVLQRQERRVLPAIARKADGSRIARKEDGPPQVTPQVAADIENGQAGGRPLPSTVRRFMEPRFRADFGHIRIHTGDHAARLSRQLRARAFTFGNQIYFAQGQWSPETPEGQELIAHELTHTIQQGAAVQRSEDTSAAPQPASVSTSASAPEVQRSEQVSVNQHATPHVQRLGLSDALDYFADKANLIPGFRMFTIVLGVNPINMGSVDRSAANILRAIVEFLPGGGLITEALDKYGVFEQVGGWIEQQLQSLGLTGSSIRQAVMDFLDSLGWSDIFDLGGVWDRAKSIFSGPIDRIISFVRSLAGAVLKFIKDAILRPLAKLAEGTAGWDLLKAVLGQDPITGDPVPQTADTLIGGFMKLIGQEEIWNNLKKANAVARAWAWFQGALNGLIGFVRQIPGLFLQALEALEIADIVLLPRAFAKVGAVFGGFFSEFVSWAGNTIWDLLEIIFAVVAPGVMGYLRKAAAAFKSILKNPIGFVANLVNAGKLGFQQFAGNIIKHLKKALIDWLTSSLSGAGIYIPQALTLAEIGKFALSIVGVTWPKIRAKIVKALGQNGETIMKALETGFDIVVALVTGGPAAAWEVIKDKLANLRDMVLQMIIDFVKDSVVAAAVKKIVGMLVPGGAFLTAILTIYDTVMVFVERLKQIAAVVASFIDSIAAIAAGNIGAAANRVESTMAGLLSLVIAFLARFAGFGKVSGYIVDKVKGVQAKVDQALDKGIELVIGKAKAFIAKLFGKGKDKKDDPKARLTAAVGEVQRLMDAPEATLDSVQSALPGIRGRHQLTSLQLIKDEEDIFHAEAVINPREAGRRGVAFTSEQLRQIKALGQQWAAQIRARDAENVQKHVAPAGAEIRAYQADKRRYVVQGPQATTGVPAGARLESGLLVELLGIEVVKEHAQGLTVLRNVQMDLFDADGRQVASKQAEIDFLIVGKQGIVELVSAKLGGTGAVRRSGASDRASLRAYSAMPVQRPGIGQYARANFRDREARYEDAVSVRVSFTTDGGGGPLSLAEFRTRYVGKGVVDNVKVTGLVPAPKPGRGASGSLTLAATRSQLLNKVIRHIDQFLGLG